MIKSTMVRLCYSLLLLCLPVAWAELDGRLSSVVSDSNAESSAKAAALEEYSERHLFSTKKYLEEYDENSSSSYKGKVYHGGSKGMKMRMWKGMSKGKGMSASQKSKGSSDSNSSSSSSSSKSMSMSKSTRPKSHKDSNKVDLDNIVEPFFETVVAGILIQLWDIIKCPPVMVRSLLTAVANRRQLQAVSSCGGVFVTLQQVDRFGTPFPKVEVGNACPRPATNDEMAALSIPEIVRRTSLVQCCAQGQSGESLVQFLVHYSDVYSFLLRRFLREVSAKTISNTAHSYSVYQNTDTCCPYTISSVIFKPFAKLRQSPFSQVSQVLLRRTWT